MPKKTVSVVVLTKRDFLALARLVEQEEEISRDSYGTPRKNGDWEDLWEKACPHSYKVFADARDVIRRNRKKVRR